MARKPEVLLEGWQLLILHGRPFQLWGYASNHPRLGGFRRHIATSRVLKLHGNRAETVNTIYELRYPIHDVVFHGALPMRVLIGDLVAEREHQDIWRIRRGRQRLSTGLPGLHAAVLAMLALLDRERKRPG
jgi:hypothetical protein